MHISATRALFVAFLYTSLTGCTLGGIRSADEFSRPRPRECRVWVTDGRHAECLDGVGFQRWRQRNGL